MSFADCVCHVWAIDGYTTDQRAKQVNDQYDRLANEVMKLESTDLNGKVAGLVATVRKLTQASTATVDCTIYGGFQYATDGAPEHMWFESGDWIYDTFRNAPLRRKRASSESRLHPGCEETAFSPNLIGRCTARMTMSQIAMLAAASGKWANDEFYG